MIIWKKVSFRNSENNIISDLTKIINEKIEAVLKPFKTESSKHLSESLTWYKKQTNILKKEYKSKDMNIAKLSRTIKKTHEISRDVQTNSNASAADRLSSDSDRTQEEVAESLKTKQLKIKLKQQLEQLRLQKKLAFNKYKSQQRDKNLQDQDICPP